MTKKEPNYYAPPIITYTIGVIMLFFLVKGINKYQDMNNWSKTSAVIVEATPLHIIHEDNDYYVPDITYRYDVDGIEYHSSVLSYDKTVEQCSSLTHCKQVIADTYQPATTITAYYNPNQPSEAVVKLGNRVGALFVIFFICVLMFSLAIRAHYLSGSIFKAVGTCDD